MALPAPPSLLVQVIGVAYLRVAAALKTKDVAAMVRVCKCLRALASDRPGGRPRVELERCSLATGIGAARSCIFVVTSLNLMCACVLWRVDREGARPSHARGGPSRRYSHIGVEGARAIAAVLVESKLTSLSLWCVRVLSRARVAGYARRLTRRGGSSRAG